MYVCIFWWKGGSSYRSPFWKKYVCHLKYFPNLKICCCLDDFENSMCVLCLSSFNFLHCTLTTPLIGIQCLLHLLWRSHVSVTFLRRAVTEPRRESDIFVLLTCCWESCCQFWIPHDFSGLVVGVFVCSVKEINIINWETWEMGCAYTASFLRLCS